MVGWKVRDISNISPAHKQPKGSMDISTDAPPHQSTTKESPLVEPKKPASQQHKNHKQRQQKKLKQRQKGPQKQPATMDDLVDITEMDELPWQKIGFPAAMPFSEGAAGGFVDFEELDNVDVEYVETDRGRMVKFRVGAPYDGGGCITIGSHSMQRLDAPLDTIIEEKEEYHVVSLENEDSKMEDQDDDEGDSDDDEAEDSDMDEEEREALKAMKAFEEELLNNPSSTAKANDTPTVEPATIDATKEEPSDEPNEHWLRFGLHPRLIKALNGLKFEKPTEIQAQVLPLAIRKKRDIVGAAETVRKLR